MNPYVIITDSSCDLPQSVVAEYGLEVVQLSVSLDGGAPTPNNELDIKDFYAFTKDDFIIEDYEAGPQIKDIPIAI